jgi:transcriptional regulator with XRE-family HTH domain
MGKGASGVTSADSPTVRRRELGVLLRTLRTEAGMTVEQVAERLMVSSSKISRLETGRRGAQPRDIRDLCDIYGVTDAAREHLMELAHEGRDQAWWQPFDLPYETYVGLEAAAVLISDYEPGVFPALLQTSEYARAIHEGALPRLSQEVMDQRIEARRLRQEVLAREEPPQLWAVIDEAVLYRPVGNPEVMHSQLEKVIEACALPNVDVRILPESAGAHPALNSTFVILDFTPPVPGMVYVDGLVGQIYLERPQDFERYKKVFERLSELSLSSEESVRLMRQTSIRYDEAGMITSEDDQAGNGPSVTGFRPRP